MSDIESDKTLCSKCKELTLSILSEDRTHYNCEICRGIK